jgi:hypothetical protein
MQREPFLAAEGGRYLPNRSSRGPWNPESLHGRVVIALLAHEIERAYGATEFQPARLTVDLYRLPGFEPIEVTTRAVRSGKRIRVIDAELRSGGVDMARATCQLLRRTRNAEGRVWCPAPWQVPAPEELPPPAAHAAFGGMWESRAIEGGFGTVGTKKTWMREVRTLVAGTALTPLVRAALASDFANPFANSGDQGLGYINSDVTLYLHRLPAGEWIGLEVVDHQATSGVAIGACRLHDREGPIGTASVAALAQRRGA